MDGSGLCGNTGTGTPLVEHHGDSLSGHGSQEALWDSSRLDGLLVRGGIAHQSREFRGRQVCNREEMARSEGRRSRRGLCLVGKSSESISLECSTQGRGGAGGQLSYTLGAITGGSCKTASHGGLWVEIEGRLGGKGGGCVCLVYSVQWEREIERGKEGKLGGRESEPKESGKRNDSTHNSKSPEMCGPSDWPWRLAA